MLKKYTVTILIVFVISQISLSALILSLSNRAQRERTKTRETAQVTQGYLRCVFLAKFEHPEAVAPDATKQEVENALNECAKR